MPGDGLMSRLNMTEERISKLEDMSTKNFKTEKRIKTEKQNRISKDCGTITKEIAEEDRKEQKKYLKQ